MDEQERVARFVEAHHLSAPPAYRLLDLVSEVGELAKAAAESTEYGDGSGAIEVPEDEVGDALFSLLALADGLDVDAGEALEVALAKYERRLAERGTGKRGVNRSAGGNCPTGADSLWSGYLASTEPGHDAS